MLDCDASQVGDHFDQLLSAPPVTDFLLRSDTAMLGGSGYARNDRDFYATPDDVSEAICAALVGHRFLSPRSTVWEPACGDWALAGVMEKHFDLVIGSDIEPLDARGRRWNFLNTTPKQPFDAIVTNPPFNADGGASADDFVARGLHHIRTGRCRVMALLMRHEFDCGVGRVPIFGGCPEFAAKVVLTWRPRWIKDSKGSPRHNYSWFVWTDAGAVTTSNGPQVLYALRNGRIASRR